MFLDSGTGDSTGILIDWDLSKPVKTTESHSMGARRVTRTVSTPMLVLFYTIT